MLLLSNGFLLLVLLLQRRGRCGDLLLLLLERGGRCCGLLAELLFGE